MGRSAGRVGSGEVRGHFDGFRVWLGLRGSLFGELKSFRCRR
jgi:hypothetical protein